MWFKWLLIALYVLETAITIGKIGQPRTPLTPSDAIATMIVAGLIILGILHYWPA